jgi:tetratricopeptide (TPR) repeat protein
MRITNSYDWTMPRRGSKRQRRLLPRLSSIVAVIALTGPAIAGDREICLEASGEIAIAACVRDVSSIAGQFIDRGRVWQVQGQPDRAIENFDEATKLNPLLPQAYINLASAYIQKGDFDRALSSADRAIELTTKRVRAMVDLARWYTNQNLHDRIVAEFAHGIGRNAVGESTFVSPDESHQVPKPDPDRAAAFNNRGVAHLHKGEYDRAVADLDEAIKLDPADARTLANRANAFGCKHAHDRAQGDFSQVAKLDPTSVAVFDAPALSNRCPVDEMHWHHG